MRRYPWLTVPVVLLMSNNLAFAQAQTNPDRQPVSSDHVYLGGWVGVYDDAEIDPYGPVNDAVIYSSGLSYSLATGYEIGINRVVKFGIELEYRNFSDSHFGNGIELSGNAFFVNVRPKFVYPLGRSEIYLALNGGTGRAKLRSKLTWYNLSETDTKMTYQYGGEIGILFKQHYELNLGYRSTMYEIGDFDFTLNTGYVGFRYYF